jgi:hypothetical protein
MVFPIKTQKPAVSLTILTVAFFFRIEGERMGFFGNIESDKGVNQ